LGDEAPEAGRGSDGGGEIGADAIGAATIGAVTIGAATIGAVRTLGTWTERSVGAVGLQATGGSALTDTLPA